MIRISGRMTQEGADRAAMVRARAWHAAAWAALIFAFTSFGRGLIALLEVTR